VAPKGLDRGKATVSINGGAPVTVNLSATSEQPRKVVFAKEGLDPSETYTLEVQVLGGPRVDVDAFAVLSPP
jgi:hypothetical protein